MEMHLCAHLEQTDHRNVLVEISSGPLKQPIQRTDSFPVQSMVLMPSFSIKSHPITIAPVSGRGDPQSFGAETPLKTLRIREIRVISKAQLGSHSPPGAVPYSSPRFIPSLIFLELYNHRGHRSVTIPDSLRSSVPYPSPPCPAP